MNKNKTIIIVFVLLLASAVCCVISIAGYFIYDKYKDQKEDDRETESSHEIGSISSSVTTTVTEEDEESEDSEEVILPDLHGYINGHLGFPSEFIPPLKVCAENVLSGVPICIETAENQTEYSIEVEPAGYYVYSEVLTGDGGYEGYRAYYSDFITCGETFECTSHNPVVVNVNIGETVNNIDPKDWYDF